MAAGLLPFCAGKGHSDPGFYRLLPAFIGFYRLLPAFMLALLIAALFYTTCLYADQPSSPSPKTGVRNRGQSALSRFGLETLCADVRSLRVPRDAIAASR